MARRRITVEHLGAEATERDVEIFEEAVSRLAVNEFNDDEEAAEAYLWGNGDYFRRLPPDLQDAYTGRQSAS